MKEGQTTKQVQTIGTTRKKRKKLSVDDLQLIVMATPTLIWFLLFSILPMLGVLIAFKNFRISGGGFIDSFFKSEWVGFENFEFLFSTSDAFIITRNTLLYNLSFIILDIAVPVAFALMLHEIKKPESSEDLPDYPVSALFSFLGGGEQLPVCISQSG